MKTLRHYDDAGLLRPARVDSLTGYRYYFAGQFRDLHRILALKAMGLTLAQIGGVVRDELTQEQLIGMLRLSQAQLRQRMAEAGWIASIRQTVQNLDALGPLFPELESYIQAQGGAVSGPGMIVYNTAEFWEAEVDAEAAFPIAGPIPGSARVTVAPAPPLEMATLVYDGSFEEVRGAHAALAEWIEERGQDLAGPHRTVFLHCGSGAGERTVVELQYPIAASAR